eukprot:865812-Rhodomonas_salina.1
MSCVCCVPESEYAKIVKKSGPGIESSDPAQSRATIWNVETTPAVTAITPVPLTRNLEGESSLGRTTNSNGLPLMCLMPPSPLTATDSKNRPDWVSLHGTAKSDRPHWSGRSNRVDDCTACPVFDRGRVNI